MKCIKCKYFCELKEPIIHKIGFCALKNRPIDESEDCEPIENKIKGVGNGKIESFIPMDVYLQWNY